MNKLHKENKRDIKEIEKDKKVLSRFISIYCHKNHSTSKGALCEKCLDLIEYSFSKLEKCPFNPKPKCKDCKTHCYKPDYRKRIKEIMKFSGIYYAKRGRIDWLIKYFT